MRELVLQIIDRRAPNDEVKKASWYEVESEQFSVTRRQKLKYCAQGFLSDGYLTDDALEDLNASISEYLKEFRFFNKYTHITEKHYKTCPKTFYRNMKFIVQRSTEVIKELDSLENLVLTSIPDSLQEKLFHKVIDSFPEQLSILASNVVVEQVLPEELEVEYMDENGIIVDVSGTVYVTQEYGKGEDFTEMQCDYPFNISIAMSVDSPLNITIKPSDFSVDNSSWFGDDENL